MNIFKKKLTIFYRTKHIFIVTILTILGVIAKNIYEIFMYNIHHDAMYYFDEAQACSFPLFIIGLYISYEYIYKLKNSNIEECLSTNKNGVLKLYGTGFLVLFIYPIINFLISAIFCTSVSIHKGITDFSFYHHIFMVSLLNFFLLSLLSVLIGGTIALRLKRIPAYSIIALIIFIISPISDMIPGLASDAYNKNFWPYKWVFSKILPPNLSWFNDNIYGVSNETLRWNLMLFWILLFTAIIVSTLLKRKGKVRPVAIVLILTLAFGNLYGYFLGGSERNLSLSPDSMSEIEYRYYRDIAKQKEEKPLFTISEYNIDFNIKRELTAKAELTLNNPNNIKDYKFTLYRGYKIQSITDKNKNNLNYNLDGDYFTIKADKPIKKVIIHYKGHSPIFYSNSQATCLPGSFPYYPMPGFFKLNNTHYKEKDALVIAQGYIPIINDFKSNYKVTVNSSKPIYSNIKKVEGKKNTFSGNSQSLTLLSGFIKDNSTSKYSKCTSVVFPEECTDDVLSKINNITQKFEKENYNTSNFNLKNKKFFRVASALHFANYNFVIDLGDHMLTQGINPNAVDNQLAKEVLEGKVY